MNDDIKETVKEILANYLELDNQRKTPERFAILDAVYSIKGHFSLNELGERLEANKFPVSRATLYNTLNLFIKLRLVICHHFQRGTYYEAIFHNENHCHQICTICGNVTEEVFPNISNAINDAHLKRFRKAGYSLYIYGICSNCQAKLTRNKNKEQKKIKDNKNEYR
jgi:Fur family ferric uptake transcriptional regulator